MHSGRFQTSVDPSHGAPSARRAVLDEPVLSRRHLAGALLCLGAGAVAGFRFRAGPTAADDTRAGPGTEDPPTRRADLAWALSMAARSDRDLLEAAGDLEMVGVRHRDDRRLIAVFDRLLDAALGSTDVDLLVLDVAGACAVRSLGRLGADALVEARAADLLAVLGGRPRTREAFDHAARRRGRRPSERR